MRVLYVARYDAAGQGYLLTKAMREDLGWEAENWVTQQTYLGYPIDKKLTQETVADMEEYAKTADFIIFQEAPINTQELGEICTQKNTCVHVVGSIARNNLGGILQAQHENALKVVNCLGDPTIAPHLLCTSPFDPFMIDTERIDAITESVSRSETIRVAHAVTNPDVKGTALFQDIMARHFEDVEFDVMTGLAWTECIARKAKAHILLDSISDHMYGISALEGAYMGQPVVSNISPWCYALHPNLPMHTFAPEMTGKTMTEGIIASLREAIENTTYKDNRKTRQSNEWAYNNFAPSEVVVRWKHWINWVMKG